MMNQYILPALLVALVVSYLVYKNKENFDPEYSSPKDLYIKTSQTKTDYPYAISSGDIQKYRTDNGYIYLLKFNLPDSAAPFQVQDLDLKFNAKTKPVPYEVYADGIKLGELKRGNDGWFQMELLSKEDYSEFKIYMGVALVGAAKV